MAVHDWREVIKQRNGVFSFSAGANCRCEQQRCNGRMEMEARLELLFAVWLKHETPIPFVVLGQSYDLPSTLPIVWGEPRDTANELLVSGRVQQGDKLKKRMVRLQVLK